mmetsp:Transcript_17331/g.56300  ORF Transcript_17331/g.56300 Transcript_17331/m.56300 type:complete len:221 (-) Transcript_17331:317-979(-)
MLRKKRSSRVAWRSSFSAMQSQTGVERSAARRALERSSEDAPMAPTPKIPHAAMLLQSGRISPTGRAGNFCDEQSRLYDACKSAKVQPPPPLLFRPRSTMAHSRSCWCCGSDSSSATARDLKVAARAADMCWKRSAGLSSQAGREAAAPPPPRTGEAGETRSSSAAASAAAARSAHTRVVSGEAWTDQALATGSVSGGEVAASSAAPESGGTTEASSSDD